MADPLNGIGTRRTPQTEPVLGRTDQVGNNAGGYVFAVDKWTQALRFLILGTAGGSYYATEKELTSENAKIILDLARTDGVQLVNIIVDVSVSGRAPKQNPTLFALAVCAASDDLETRRAAVAAIGKVCRIGTHLFIFARYVEQFRGWGRGLRNAISDWYTTKSVDDVAYQAVKYRQREGWSHRDLLRLAHPKTGPGVDAFDWILRGYADGHAYPGIINGYELAQHATTGKEWAQLVDDYKLPWEALPDAALNEAVVWEALLPHLGLTALIRQLNRLTKIGVISPFGAKVPDVVDKLTNADALKKARVHPLQVLIALETYRSGHGLRGDMTWDPHPKVVAALDAAFRLAFGAVEPSNKNTLLCLDVSGSMAWSNIANTPITPRVASAALAVVAAATEPSTFTMAFSHALVQVPIDGNMSVAQAMDMTARIPMGGTDCSLPMMWAMQNNVPAETFVVYTDSETWSGRGTHPFQALRMYREKMGIDARLVVVGMVSNGFTIADPTDAGMLDVVGFDTATPSLINAFSRGEV